MNKTRKIDIDFSWVSICFFHAAIVAAAWAAVNESYLVAVGLLNFAALVKIVQYLRIVIRFIIETSEATKAILRKNK